MSDSVLERFQENSYLAGINAAYIEGLYDDFLKDPLSVDAQWRSFFSSLPQVGDFVSKDVIKSDLIKHFRELAQSSSIQLTLPSSGHAQASVDAMINSFRRFAHLYADTNPLERKSSHMSGFEKLTPDFYGLNLDDPQSYHAHGLLGNKSGTIKQIYKQLQSIYLNHVGFEYQNIYNDEIRLWLQNEIESQNWSDDLSSDQAIVVAKELVASAGLEKYLDTKYVGQTRFSLSGAEGVIPLITHLARSAMSYKINTLALGMAHRGRVNVLLNIFGKMPQKLYDEFDGEYPVDQGTGDIKYHNGYSTDIEHDNHVMHMTLAFNPSHLEYIAPVVMGGARARQNQHRHLPASQAVLPVFIHGDAAFSGEGVVMESLQMSGTNAYHVGGSVHLVLNNQIGFTTSRVSDARTSTYAASVASIIEAPVFHVHGEDFASIYKVVSLALAYRMKFNKDVVIDFIGFRRPGHNEADEPRATQPVMYQKVDQHPGIANIFTDQLVKKNICTAQDVKAWQKAYRSAIASGDQCLSLLPVVKPADSSLYSMWQPFLEKSWQEPVDKAFPLARLNELAQAFYSQIPSHFNFHSRVKAIVKNRCEMACGDRPIDWGFAENLAYATLMDQGYSVRMSGQDARRGTFFHRHAALFDQDTGEYYEPLQQFGSKETYARIYDSMLCEAGALGFEYGYSTSSPQELVIWEAQFGDFANAAQVIIDQFISSGWQKWRRLSGLVMLLPHGYEGRGPEHSSARLERFLQLCAQDNIQVCVPSTPAQIFHLLRRQVLREFRKPLVVMTPKSLLRHPEVVSSMSDLAQKEYRLVIGDGDIAPSQVKRLVLCSGKVYYDLKAARSEHNIDTIPIVRIEQLYPFPYMALSEVLSLYPNLKEVVWCQEEPKNQGAWFITKHRLLETIDSNVHLVYAGREPMAAAAPGYVELFKKQQEALIKDALAIS